MLVAKITDRSSLVVNQKWRKIIMVSMVNKDKIYTIHYRIKDTQGNTLEASPDDAPITFYPGDGSVLPVIEQAVINAGENNKMSLTVSPEDAFGRYDASLKFKVRRNAFLSNEPLKLDQTIYANTPSGKRFVRITDLTSSTVSIDANHELAGKTLLVDIDIIKA